MLARVCGSAGSNAAASTPVSVACAWENAACAKGVAVASSVRRAPRSVPLAVTPSAGSVPESARSSFAPSSISGAGEDELAAHGQRCSRGELDAPGDRSLLGDEGEVADAVRLRVAVVTELEAGDVPGARPRAPVDLRDGETIDRHGDRAA